MKILLVQGRFKILLVSHQNLSLELFACHVSKCIEFKLCFAPLKQIRQFIFNVRNSIVKSNTRKSDSDSRRENGFE